MNYYLIIQVATTILIRNARGVQPDQVDNGSGAGIESKCYTPQCTIEAKNIINNMDTTVSYCQDFYNFACGQFTKNRFTMDDINIIGTVEAIHTNNLKYLGRLIDNITNQIPPFKLLKSFKDACIQLTWNENSNRKTLLNLLMKYSGLLDKLNDKWIENNVEFGNIINEIASDGFGADFLFKVSVEISNENPNKYEIMIDVPSFEIPRDNFVRGINDYTVNSYYKYLINIVKYISDFKIDLNEIESAILFERYLAMISPSEGSKDDITHSNFMTIDTLQAKYPIVNWFEFLKNYFSPYAIINENEMIFVKVPQFLDKLIPELRRTSKTTLVTYILLRIMSQSAPFLSEYTKYKKNEFLSIISGQVITVPLHDKCVEVVQKYLPVISGIFYIQSQDSSITIHNIEALQNIIKLEFKHYLEHFSWMNSFTKDDALDKLNGMPIKIGYPKDFYDRDNLIRYYNNLTIERNKYLQSVLNVRRQDMQLNLSKLRNTVGNNAWINEHILSVKTEFYKPNQNSLEIPYGVINGVFYNPNRPNYLNYGAIGVAIAREMVHSIDNIGKSYGPKGELHKWWSAKIENNFRQNSSCFIDQYNNFSINYPGLPVDGIATNDENVADYIGLKIAYSAYKTYSSLITSAEVPLPTLSFNPFQFFWISYANTHCKIYRPQTYEYFLNSITYSPPNYRVNGPLMNLPEFSNDFQCKTGSNMNPVDKCDILNPSLFT